MDYDYEEMTEDEIDEKINLELSIIRANKEINIESILVFAKIINKTPNKKNQIFEMIDKQVPDLSQDIKGRIEDQLEVLCYSGGSKNKITFLKDGKKVTRTVYVNKRKTKFVKYNNKEIYLSRLKLV